MTEPAGDGNDDQEFLDAAGIDPESFTDGAAPTGQRVDEVASFGARAIARAMDFMVIAIISLAFTAPTLVSDRDDVAEVPTSVALASLIGWLVYEAGTTAWLGQTMGKLAMQIRVVDVRTGAKPGFAKALLRTAIVPGLVAFVGVFGLIAYPTVVFDPATRRGLLDRIAGTAIVKAQPGPS